METWRVASFDELDHEQRLAVRTIKESSRSTGGTSGQMTSGEEQQSRYLSVANTKAETVKPPLTETQPVQIEHHIRLGLSNELIAKGVGFSRCTIEQEVGRCGGRPR